MACTTRQYKHRILPAAWICLTIMASLLLPGCGQGDRDSFGIDSPLTESLVMELSLESRCMERDMPFMIYFPEGYGGEEAYPVWYALHGYSADESMWIDFGIAGAADALIAGGAIDPMIMVFPLTRYDSLKTIQADLEDDGKRGESRMDRFLCEELVPYIDTHCNTVPSAKGRYIGGFSMGGMIALRTAFHHPDLFSKVGGYSPAMTYSDFSGRELEEWLYPYEDTETADIQEIAASKGIDKLDVWLDYGTANDPFSEGIQSLYQALQERGIDSQLHIYEGGHDLHNAMENIEELLAFYSAGE